MKPTLAFLFLSLFISTNLFSQLASPYYSQSDFQFVSPGAFKFGLYGYDNPALLEYIEHPDFQLSVSDVGGKWSKFNRWGLFTAVPNFGFGLIQNKDAAGTFNDYRLSAGWGNRSMSSGIGYSWVRGDNKALRRKGVWRYGSLIRPNKFLSVGLVGAFAVGSNAKEGVIDVGIRPFGNEKVTLFSDYTLQTKQSVKNGNWSAGIATELLDGVRFTARYFDTKAFSIGFQVNFGTDAVSTQTQFDNNGKRASNTYSLRFGAYDRTLFGTKIMPQKKYLELNLLGPVKHQRYTYFDDSNTLSDIIGKIDAAKGDENVRGIVINASGMSAHKTMLWEIREKLKEFKTTGKKIIIYLDKPDINEYHFASVADKIVLDPVGVLTLEGFVAGRTFIKGTLDKLGIGFDEWRFFKYKSAVENFSREKMSEGDREQRQRYVDEFYRTAQHDICEGRNISTEAFNNLVDNMIIFTPQEALENKLVDTLARWDVLKEIVANIEKEETKFIAPTELSRFRLSHDNAWGEPPKIAVIYALGVCAMDEGITARQLVKDVERATNDNRIKGVVLRIDSPGGDGMASDIIAEALKKCKAKKPVIISQSAVAASGGYWLSMYGDTIVSTPTTITGSIGVIGGWMYNTSFKESLGISTDFVKAGKHADIGFGMSAPFIGTLIPDRNATTEERARIESGIKTFYKEFVGKVASGRKKDATYIDSIGQGRVWTGRDAKERGLVDVLGGLETAINIAKEKAGIPTEQNITIVELPKPKLFDLGIYVPKIFGIQIPQQPESDVLHQIKFRLEHNGEAMPILPLEEMEFEK
ncbi:MAG: signal peptide peptidase SppA [Ignavibacteriales bacterium]|nr:signal peptide peptidase SppA [Ignavibacteriales bacterium]